VIYGENNMQYWEYKTIRIPKVAFTAGEREYEMTKKLNGLGQQGWELVKEVATFSSNSNCLIFKRSKAPTHT